MIRKTILTGLFFISAFFYGQAVSAQGILNAELNATPMAINPAFTGMFNGDARISALYGNKWSDVNAPYIDYRASTDLQVYTDSRGNYLAAGMQAAKEAIGDGSSNNFSGRASVAYHKFITASNDSNDNHSSDLSVGMQVGYNQGSIDLYDLNSTYFFPYSGPYQMGDGNALGYYSMNLGVCFSHAAGRNFNYTVGLSGYNVNQPGDATEKEQYSEIGIDRHFIAQAGANWKVTDRLMLRPEILYENRSGKTDVVAGNEFHYRLKYHATSIFAGVWYRTDDVITITPGVEYKNLRIAAEYAYSLSVLDLGDDNGGFTVSLAYAFQNHKSDNGNRAIPCTRF